MTAEYAKCKKRITSEQVRGWFDLIIFIRKQRILLETSISLPNLWSIFEVFALVLLILSLIVYFFLNGVLGQVMRASNFIPYSLICVFVFIASIYWKAGFAEDIASAVKN